LAQRHRWRRALIRQKIHRGAVIGFLYDHSLPALIAFSVVAELAAIPFFLVVARKGTEHTVREGSQC
jgi:hypothetical protein